MSSGLVSKIKNWVAGDPYEDEIFSEEEDFSYQPTARTAQPEPAGDPRKATSPRNNLKVLGHPSTPHTAQVMVIEPRAFEDSMEIIDHLRNRKAVILNLHLLDNAQSQRVVDFLAGATHAIDGSQQRIGDGVFIFTPSTMIISSEAQKGLSIADAYWNAPR